jgi:uncharacterized membrane protein
MATQPTDEQNETDPILKAAHKFEYWVIPVLVLIVGVITVLAMLRLLFGIYDAVFVTWDPKNYHAVQVLFGMVMTVLIALEFGNSILRHIREHSTIIQAQEVILIRMMAVVIDEPVDAGPSVRKVRIAVRHAESIAF